MAPGAKVRLRGAAVTHAVLEPERPGQRSEPGGRLEVGTRQLYVIKVGTRVENPPCALTSHVACPIAPPDNRLALAVDAGEKTYQAMH